MVTLAVKTAKAHLLCHSGRMEVLLGPSGSGKTALLRAAAGLDHAGAQVFLGGQDVSRWSAAERRVAYVAPAAALYPGCTVRQVMAAVAPAERWRSIVEQFELGTCLEVPADHLDPSLRQRVALARAVASAALVLALDEPLAAITGPSRARVRDLLLAAVDRARVLLLATADPWLAARLGGHGHVLLGGATLQRGMMAMLGSRPVNEAAARIVSVPPLSVWPCQLFVDPSGARMLQFADDLRWPAPANWAGFEPGAYRVGFPAQVVSVAAGRAGQCEVRAELVGADVVTGTTVACWRARPGLLFTHQPRVHLPPPRQQAVLALALQDAWLFDRHGRTLLPAAEVALHGAR